MEAKNNRLLITGAISWANIPGQRSMVARSGGHHFQLSLSLSSLDQIQYNVIKCNMRGLLVEIYGCHFLSHSFKHFKPGLFRWKKKFNLMQENLR